MKNFTWLLKTDYQIGYKNAKSLWYKEDCDEGLKKIFIQEFYLHFFYNNFDLYMCVWGFYYHIGLNHKVMKNFIWLLKR